MSDVQPIAFMDDPRRVTRATVVMSIVALIAAEATAAAFSVEASVACYAILFFVLLNLPLVLPFLAAEARGAIAILALIPALKIAAAVLPLHAVPEQYWEALPAALALLAVVVLRQVLGGSVCQLQAGDAPLDAGWDLQLAIAAAGPVLAVAGATVLWMLEGTGAEPGLTATSASVIASAAFSGATLEIVFRGVVQRSLVGTFGPAGGIGLSSVLYAGLFAGSGSVFFIVFGLVTGLAWGVAAEWTGALGGVAASHALFAITWAALY